LNSVSRGVISNIAGKHRELILTDARCIPGGEGSALYVQRDSCYSLVGMVLAPLCWKQNEWIGFSIACSLRPVLQSFLDKSGQQYSPDLYAISNEVDIFSPALQSLVLVRVGRIWGSGIILDKEEGLVLTCSHVVREHGNNKVKVVLSYPYWWSVPAQIVYSSPTGSVLDVAVLRVPFRLRASQDITHVPSCSAGQEVLALGHALFDEHFRLGPTVTSGVISKIVCFDNRPIMIQSTSAIHAGASGGALVSAKTGQLLGVIVCNSRDVISGASYPHVNMSAPMELIAPIIRKYLDTKDVDVLSDLHLKCPEVERLWQIQRAAIEARKSKL